MFGCWKLSLYVSAKERQGHDLAVRRIRPNGEIRKVRQQWAPPAEHRHIAVTGIWGTYEPTQRDVADLDRAVLQNGIYRPGSIDALDKKTVIVAAEAAATCPRTRHALIPYLPDITTCSNAPYRRHCVGTVHAAAMMPP